MALAGTFSISIAEIMRDLGYLGLALLMIGETVFPPIPSEAVLPLAGYLAEQGELNVLVVMVVSTVGSVTGAMFLYEAARRGGRPFAYRFLRFAHLEPEKLDEAETWFARRGAMVVLVGRCVPGLRSLVSLPAGVLQMPRWEYLLLTALGSAIWNAALVAAGYFLSARWHEVSALIDPLGTPVLAGVAVAVLLALAWVVARRRAVRARQDEA